MAVQEPKYRLLRKDGAFEIRAYGDLVVADTRVEGGQVEAVQHGFRRLAAYIFGGNAARRNIAMTAPVLLQPSAASSPALPERGAWTVRFIMPEGSDVGDLPVPRDGSVRLGRAPGGRFGVVRFSGLARPAAARDEAARLAAWLAAQKLATDGPPALAQYDPPWTLWFLRRNEILQRLQ